MTNGHTDSTSTADQAPPGGHQLTMTRVFDAPRELVFQAWTDPEQVAGWMGPKGFTTSVVTADPVPGGTWRWRIVQDDGDDEYWARGVYREIVPPERLVFTFAWEEHGVPAHETVVTVMLADLGSSTTEMTFHQAFFESAADRDNHRDGWSESFDDLLTYLSRPPR